MSPAVIFEAKAADGGRCGGFLVLYKPDGCELHTELRCKAGRDSLRAARALFGVLARDYGLTRLKTFATHDNRRAQMAAVIAGFKPVRSDGRQVYYERILNG